MKPHYPPRITRLSIRRGRTLAVIAAAGLLASACSSLSPAAPSSSSAAGSTTAGSAASSASAAGGSSAGGSAGDSPKPGGTLVTFASSDPGTMDPALVTGYDQGLIATNILEGLMRLDPSGTKLVPGLAENAQISGNTWTFTLRDAKFSNGDPVTAQDVKFSFDRLVSPAIASPRASLLDSVVGAAEARAGSADGISGIKVVNASTLTIELAHPDASFKAKLASPNLAVISEKAVQSEGAEFGRKVVSAGPFKLTDWQTNSKITATAFDGYWNGRPMLDAVQWAVIGDESTRMVNFEAGTLDIAWLPPSYYDKYANDPAWQPNLTRTNSVHTEMFAVNMKSGALATSLQARQAVCDGVDRQAAIASLQGRATAAASLAPPGLGAKDSGGCTYDPTTAKSLATAGALDGKTLKLISRSWTNQVATMQLYQANLKEAGINVDLEPLDDAAYSQRINDGDFDLAWTYRVPDYLDPDSFYSTLVDSTRIGSGNAAQLSDPQIDTDLAKALASQDDAERTTLYNSIDQAATADLAYIPLLHNVYVDIHASSVHNYAYSALDLTDYSKVWKS